MRMEDGMAQHHYCSVVGLFDVMWTGYGYVLE